MDREVIKTIVNSDLGGFAAGTDEFLRVAGLAPSATAFTRRFVNERDVISEADPLDPLYGDKILTDLETVVAIGIDERSTLIGRTLRWLQNGELDIGNPTIRAQITAMAETTPLPQILTAEQRDALLGMATPKTIWDAGGIDSQLIATAHIAEARLI